MMPYLISTAFVILTLNIIILKYFRKRRSKFQELIYMMSQDQYEYILLDVRPKAEYEKGHLAKATNISFGELYAYMPTENMFEKIFVYGRNSTEARKARAILGHVGYFNVQSFGSYRTIMKYKRYLEKEKFVNHEHKR